MKIAFAGDCGVSGDKIASNIAFSHSLGMPSLPREAKENGRRLAIVGGGPSILRSVDEIRGYADVFAINGTHRFLLDHGIESTFVSVDCGVEVIPFARGVKKAILASRCDPGVFAEVEGAAIFDLQNDIGSGLCCGSSTATSCFHIGLELGYRDITFYGCEGSFDGASHAYRDEKRTSLMWVSCGGVEYVTTPDFYVQSQEIAAVIRMCPAVFHERSGGLLGAMVQNEEHDITGLSRGMLNTFSPEQRMEMEKLIVAPEMAAA